MKSYLELFKLAPTLGYSPAQTQKTSQYLKEAQDSCVRKFKERDNSYEQTLRRAQDELKRQSAHLTDPQRHEFKVRVRSGWIEPR